MEVYINGNKIEYNKKYDLNIFTKNLPRINFTKKRNKFYTIIMIDPDAPSKKNPIYKYWLHYLVMNNHNTIVDYYPPSPPPKSGEHRYYILIFKQQNIINDKLNITDRKNFNYKHFVTKYGLKLVHAMKFITENLHQ